MGVATHGDLHCTMCGATPMRTLTLHHGMRYTCTRCGREGIYQSSGLQPLPLEECPTGLDPDAWARAVAEVNAIGAAL